jgi:DNA-binding transcriptional LysR family regulator
LIDAADRAIASIEPDAASFTGRLRVSCSHAFAKFILIPALPDWQRLHPGLELEIGISDGIAPAATQNASPVAGAKCLT